MSEMQKVKVNFNDQFIIVDALKELGFNPISHENAVPINAWGSQHRKAHIVVTKDQFRGMADLGFERQKDGTYIMHVDGDDIRRGSLDVNKIKRNYTKIRVKKHLKSQSQYSIINEEEKTDGSVVINLNIEDF